MSDPQASRFEMQEGDFFLVLTKRDYVREPAGSPKGGEFAPTGGSEEQLQGDEEDRLIFYHGTPKQRLDHILDEGIQVAHAGEIWPGISHQGTVYLTSDEQDAEVWAAQAARREQPGGRAVGNWQLDSPPIAILTIRVPEEVLSKLTRDKNLPGMSHAKQFEGNIPPEWIIGAKIGTPATDPDFVWEDVPIHHKAAGDGQIVYVVLVLGSRQSIAKFDEEKHPRVPGGSTEGGEFTSLGGGAIASDPALVKQATDGIAAVEKILPEAIKTAVYEEGVDWMSLSPAQQAQVYQDYVENPENIKNVKWEAQQLMEESDSETAKKALREVKANEPEAKAIAEAAKENVANIYVDREIDWQDKAHRLDINTLSVPPGQPGEKPVPLDLEALRHTDGSTLQQYEKEIVQYEWQQQYAAVLQAHVTKLLLTPPYITARLKEKWEGMIHTAKTQWVQEFREKDPGAIPDPSIEPPSKWVTGVEEGSHDDEDYARTHAIAEQATILRTEEIRKERGLLGLGKKPTYVIRQAGNFNPKRPMFVAVDETGQVIAGSNTMPQVEANAEEWATSQQELASKVKTQDLIESVWSSWKHKSSEGMGLSLQLAAANEFHGVHRMTQDEEDEAIQAAKPYGGIPTLQAYVRAQWEVTQAIMKKAGESKVDVYRALMLSGEQVAEAKQVQIDKAGNPLAPPTNIKPIPATSHTFDKALVAFDFAGEHFVVEKKQVPAKNITEIEPQHWEDVSKTTQQQVFEHWLKDDSKDVVAGHSASAWEGMIDSTKLSWFRHYLFTGKVEYHIPARPLESDEEAVKRRVAEYLTSFSAPSHVYQKLPELNLRRAGAQSTTGTLSVANEWNGVGDLPEDPTRVVLRIEAPPTSVLSLPVYGKNIIGEHESVLIGTKDKWLWDAWKERAPDFKSQPMAHVVKAEKAETKPLVIDLQAEDRGKPHWMSDVDWAKLKLQSIAKETP